MPVELTDEKKDKLELFLFLLTEYNKKCNLTSICDEKEIKIKHFYDSIYPEKFISKGAKVNEIGSGGGFPSIPLKIVRDDLEFVLVESTGKKCDFLNFVVDKLGLTGVKVVNSRAEELAKNALYREKFDYSVARAVARLNTLCEYCLPFVKVNGKFIAYKSDSEEEIKESLNAVKVLGGALDSLEKYELPEDEGKRTAVIIKKIKPTDLKYPRGRGLERKKPL